MSIRKTIVNGICTTGLALAFVTGLNFYRNHDKAYENKNELSASKIDGILDHTTAIFYKCPTKGIDVIRRFPTYRILTDINKDNIVDRIYLRENSQTIERNKDFNSHNEAFEEADKEFKKQMKRFRPSGKELLLANH